MKNSFELEKNIDKKFKEIIEIDKRDIDNPNKFTPIRLDYIDRLRETISIIQKFFPKTSNINIGDFACAQGNLSLILAELGYNVYAFELDSNLIEYSKLKYERGNIKWINENINNLNFSEKRFDIAIAGELIEHCAYPKDIIKRIFSLVQPGGFLLITTPNGSRIFNNLPNYEEVISKQMQRDLEKRQFGALGNTHLFLFKLKELKNIIPKKGLVIETGYLGGSILINKYSLIFLKLFFSYQFIEYLTRIFSKIPILNKKFFNNFYVLIKKKHD